MPRSVVLTGHALLVAAGIAGLLLNPAIWPWWLLATAVATAALVHAVAVQP